MRTRDIVLLLALGICGSGVAGAQEASPSRLAGPIDERVLVLLPGNVRRDLTVDRDLGPVEDGLQLRLYLVLQRSPAQQADLDNLLARQQQPTAPEYHQWLTPQEFGARFGASPQDLATLSTWLESHGFQVYGALNNLSMIDFSATAGQVRAAFHSQLRYYNIQGGRYLSNAQDPQIPAALAPVVAGIAGLSKIPPGAHHTPIHRISYDGQAHRWRDLGPASAAPRFLDGSGDYAVTPQDFYTIYNLNPIFTAGNLGAGATIGLPEPSDMQFGTVNSGTGAASGGDLATFRRLFGVPGTLNMTVLHGSGTVPCRDPGIVSGSEDEATLDAEWSNAVAPSAHLVFMACDDTSVGNGFISALTALIDNNLADTISSSYGNSEAFTTSSEFAADDTLASQAAAQGQSFLDAAGDAGSADADQNSSTTAVHGLNVDQYAGQPLITGVGGTDFADAYDAGEGGQPVSTYWAAANSQYYGDALSYIPETPWNSSCADSIIANLNGFTGAGYCASLGRQANGSVEGGGGGFSAHYAQPSYQPGILGLNSTATKRAVPDVAFFAAAGYWGHYLVLCDSTTSSSACTSPSTFGGAGGTSFTAPQFAGVTALLVTSTGERQGNLNPALYALAKAQYSASATATACYSNGQTNNIGVTVGLPGAACIFNDITTGNNDQPCESGSSNCYVNTGAKYGMLSTTGAGSLTVAYPAGLGYDEATGLGSVNITNLIHNWNSVFTSTTGLQASLTTISPAQSTKLTATVTGGTPTGFDSEVPAVSGSASFAAGTVALGNCTLSGGSCAVTVPGSALQAGDNSVTATFRGSGTYPASTSASVTVTVTGSAIGQTITFAPLPNQALGDVPFTVSATATSGLTVGFNSQTPATCAVSVTTVTLAAVGTCTIQATQGGNSTYAPATPVDQSFQVMPPTLQSISVAPASTSIAKGLTLQFTATGTYSDTSTANVTSSVTWGSGTTATATITVGGLASAVGVGMSNITAASGSVVGSAVLMVTPPVLQSISVAPASPSIAKGLTLQFTATGTYSDTSTANLAGQVTWGSGTTATATITSGGLATAVGVGMSNISATFSGVTGSTVLTVTPASQSIAFNGLPNQAYGTPPFTVSATATSGLTVAFNSQTPATCTVSVATVTLVAVGTCTIQATQAGNSSYAPAPSVNQSFQVMARCDVTGDSAATVADVQLMINEALGAAPAVNDLNRDGVVNVVDVQWVINAVLLLGCPN